MRISRWAFVPIVGLLSCQDYFFDPKVPAIIDEAMIVRSAGKPLPADILFIVDNSCSMEDDQIRLAQNFDAFIAEIAGKDIDYQIGIITTDTSSDRGERGGVTVSTFKQNAPFALIFPFDDADCQIVGIDHGCFRGDDPNRRIISSALPAMEQVSTFQSNVRVGSCGIGDETALNAMLLALEKTGPGECNAGFLREDANLVIVIVSDEDDQPPAEQRLMVPTAVERLVQFKPAGRIRVASIVGSIDGGGSNCRPNAPSCGSQCASPPPQGSLLEGCMGRSNFCPAGEVCNTVANRCENEDLLFFSDFCHWCSYFNAPDCCTALGGDRYVEFTRAMEVAITDALGPDVPRSNCRPEGGNRTACLIDSICQDDFSNTLARIARDLISVTVYALDPPPCNPEGVTVKIGGRTLVRGTDYDISPDGGTLTLKGQNAPQQGETIEIFFTVSANVGGNEVCGQAQTM